MAHRKNNKSFTTMNNDHMKLIAVVMLIIVLLFRKQIPKRVRSVVEPFVLFLMVLILVSLFTKKTMYIVIFTLIIFLIIMMMRRETISFEKFANESEKDSSKEDDFKKMLQKELEKVQAVAEKKSDSNETSTPKPPDSSGISHLFQGDAGKALDNLDGLLKKMNGGIELKEDDKKETKPMNEDASKYSDDNKPSALKQAQKETYELINTVNALKDTIETLSPVLQEGKKLMGMFESLKI